jgi:hypothetical protein
MATVIQKSTDINGAKKTNNKIANDDNNKTLKQTHINKGR